MTPTPLGIALKNVRTDSVRTLVTIVGIAFAVLLMVFQFSLLAGFLAAAGKIVRATDGDIWLTGRGVPCFDFAAPIPSRFVELASGIPGVAAVGKVVVGFTLWRKPSGASLTVALVGADPAISGALPIPRYGSSGSSWPDAVAVDQSNAGELGIFSAPTDVEIGVTPHAATVVSITRDFGTFLGSPYVFTSEATAHRYLALSGELTNFVVVRLTGQSDRRAVRNLLQSRFPEVDVWDKDKFAAQSGFYWMIQTGAGGALITAAILGFIVGVVVVSQNVYGSVLDRIEEFATVKALGGDSWLIVRIVLYQAVICGLIGSLAGIAMAYPAVTSAKNLISWAYTPHWLPLCIFVTGLFMSAVASLIAGRRALLADPGVVFRA